MAATSTFVPSTTSATSGTAPHERFPAETIKVRRMDFDFGKELPKHWADNNPMLTALLAGLSVSFPPGERYFINSVQRFASQITDADLKERIRGFIGQEGNHTKEHIAFNDVLASRGLPVERLQKFVEARIRYMQKHHSKERNLARTAALEHLTAVLATAVLENRDLFRNTHPTVASFWIWHAIEEIEHRSVAFDVYKQCVDDEALRVRTMAAVSIIFGSLNTYRMLAMLAASGDLWSARSWARGVNVLFGTPGLLRKAMPHYLAYYRKEFHPDQEDARELVESAKRDYLGDKA